MAVDASQPPASSTPPTPSPAAPPTIAQAAVSPTPTPTPEKAEKTAEKTLAGTEGVSRVSALPGHFPAWAAKLADCTSRARRRCSCCTATRSIWCG